MVVFGESMAGMRLESIDVLGLCFLFLESGRCGWKFVSAVGLSFLILRPGLYRQVGYSLRCW